jgi:opacity protein-like surface antigen
MFLCAGTVRAQYMKTEVAVAAGGGFHFPTGTLANTTESGAGGLVGADFSLNPSWTVGGRVAYAQFDTKPGAATYDQLRFIAFDALGQLYLYPESWFTPYVSGGGGVAFEQRRSASVSDDHARFGLVGGFGLSAHQQASWWTAYTEVTYHHIMSDPGSAQFVSWNTGLRVSFGGRPF